MHIHVYNDTTNSYILTHAHTQKQNSHAHAHAHTRVQSTHATRIYRSCNENIFALQILLLSLTFLPPPHSVPLTQLQSLALARALPPPPFLCFARSHTLSPSPTFSLSFSLLLSLSLFLSLSHPLCLSLVLPRRDVYRVSQLNFLRFVRVLKVQFVRWDNERRIIYDMGGFAVRVRLKHAVHKIRWVILVAHMCDSYVWHIFVTHMCDSYVWLICVTHICDSYEWLICMTHMCDSHVWLMCVTHMCESYVWVICVSHMCDTYVWLMYVTHMCDSYVWVICTTHMCDSGPWDNMRYRVIWVYMRFRCSCACWRCGSWDERTHLIHSVTLVWGPWNDSYELHRDSDTRMNEWLEIYNMYMWFCGSSACSRCSSWDEGW